MQFLKKEKVEGGGGAPVSQNKDKVHKNFVIMGLFMIKFGK